MCNWLRFILSIDFVSLRPSPLPNSVFRVRQAHCSLARITLTVERAGSRLAFAQFLVGKVIVTCDDNGGDDGFVGGYCGGRGGGLVHLSYFARTGRSRQDTEIVNSSKELEISGKIRPYFRASTRTCAR